MERRANVVVLGAGPAGLACAHTLAKNGLNPLVVERGRVPGGLMRSIERGGYRVDVGRKELYARLPEVHTLWSELLGDDYREYPHRVGVLWKGNIVERSRLHKGFFRGIPWWVLMSGGAEFAARQLVNPLLPPPKNEEEYWHRLRGKLFSEVLSQGHSEKFQGHAWSDLPPPSATPRGMAFVRKAARSVFARATVKDHGHAEWRHPARSTGQIIDKLVEGIEGSGGELMLGASVQSIVESGTQVTEVRGEADGESFVLKCDHVVSSVPLDILARLLGEEPPSDLKARDTRRRSTILVYLFSDAPPKFPHAWLDVTDPTLRAGRITNYAGFHGDMVPPGKACLAVEMFLVGDDPLLQRSEDALLSLAVTECARSGLLDPVTLTDHLVLKLPGAFAADDYRSWQSPGVSAFLDRLGRVDNLWNVNRAGTDVATYAGLMAGDGIVKKQRDHFLKVADPRRPLGIDSTRLWS